MGVDETQMKIRKILRQNNSAEQMKKAYMASSSASSSRAELMNRRFESIEGSVKVAQNEEDRKAD